jgi:hypothetical protein
MPIEIQSALRGLPQAHDGSEGGSFTCTIAAQQKREFATRYLQIHAMQNMVSANVRMHIFQFEQYK